MKTILTSFLAILFSLQLVAQFDSTSISADSTVTEIDSLQIALQDSLNKILVQEKIKNDSASLVAHTNFADNIFSWARKNSPSLFNIQQKRITENNLGMFAIIMLLLVLLTYLRLAYSNDFDELIYSTSSSNRALQIYRTQTDSFSVASFLLTANFVLCSVFFIQFSAQYFFPSHASQASITTVLLVILFTSFLFLKSFLFNLLSFTFPLKEILSLYKFHFYKTLQILGITMLPVVLFMFAGNKKYFVFAFGIACILLLIGVVMLIIRGLSTSIKFTASNIKYFFIYVCISEAAMVLLLIKLLTKIVS